MARRKIKRKELLKKPDEFITLSTKAILFANEHKRAFTYVGAGIVIIALVYLGIFSYFKYINKKGQQAYDRAYYSMLNNINGGSGKAPLSESEELFNDVIDDYGMSKVANLALPELAYIKFQEKRYDEAISQYRQFVDSLSENDPYRSLAMIAMATCYEEKGGLNRAIEILEQVISGPHDFFNELAMLNLARLYRLKDNHEKSTEILKDFLEKYPHTQLNLGDHHLGLENRIQAQVSHEVPNLL